jgi:hypothetical protein
VNAHFIHSNGADPFTPTRKREASSASSEARYQYGVAGQASRGEVFLIKETFDEI